VELVYGNIDLKNDRTFYDEQHTTTLVQKNIGFSAKI
jgi:hypothetical protein